MNTIITAIAILATIVLGISSIVFWVGLARARQTIWQGMIRDYESWCNDDITKLRMERIKSVDAPRMFGYAPILWIGNATDRVDVRVNFITGNIYYRWADGTKKYEQLGRFYSSSVLRDIDESLR